MITFRKILSAIKAKYLTPRSLENNIFLNTQIRVVPGTIRPKADKDDAWFFLLARHAQTILDIGANIGYNALLACIANKTSQIILVDPNPDALSIAAKNLIFNNFSNRCRFYPLLLTDKPDQQVKFYTIGTGAAGSIYKFNAHSASTVNSYYTLTSSTIDKLIEEIDIIPDFVKIDVEGAEGVVLKGASTLVKSQQTRFLVEMHSAKEMSMQENAQTILDWCNESKYKSWYLRDGIPLNNSSQIASRGRCHLLLQPIDWLYPEYLTGIKEGTPLSVIA